MSIYRNHLPIMGASGQSTGYTIDQSIRFNDDDDAYLAKTFSSASNRRTFTISTWVKRGNISTNQQIFGPYTSSSGSGTYGVFRFSSDNTFNVFDYTNGTTNYAWYSSPRVFRDSSAWYHIVASIDTTLVTASERIKVYINGVRDVGWSGNDDYYPSLNYQGQFNNALVHEIGRTQANTQKLDAYLADFHFIDGYAYDSSYFGEFNSSNIWIPKEYTGSYGSNGFKIDGRDSSDLGDDESGNGNDFTTSGLVATDKRTDSPTNNHATFSPLINANAAYANGNVQTSISSAYGKAFMSFTLPNTGTWYWEGQEFNNVTDPATAQGIVDADVEILDDKAVGNRMSSPMGTFTGIVVYSGPGQSLASYTYKNGSLVSTSATAILSTSRLGYLWEPENNRFTIYDDGSQHTQFTSIDAGNYIFGVTMATGGAPLSFRLFVEANDWTETPSGITSANALNTKNIGS